MYVSDAVKPVVYSGSSEYDYTSSHTKAGFHTGCFVREKAQPNLTYTCMIKNIVTIILLEIQHENNNIA